MRNASIGMVACLTLALAGRVAQADPVDGPAWRVDTVEAFAVNTYRESFYGGELARVRVVGDGDTDLDLYVYDEFGNLVASDTGITDICTVLWRPLWTGPFTIRVVNRGTVYNRFTIRAD